MNNPNSAPNKQILQKSTSNPLLNRSFTNKFMNNTNNTDGNMSNRFRNKLATRQQTTFKQIGQLSQSLNRPLSKLERAQ